MENCGQSEASSYWFEGIAYQFFRPSELPEEVEIVVIGGGLLGVATGYWLARLGTNVLLLESSYLGAGASGANAGLMLPASCALEDPVLVESVLREEGIEAEYSVSGHMALATSTEVWEAFCVEATRRKEHKGAFDLYVLDRSECEDVLKMPISQAFLGGRWFPGGRLVHPLKLLYRLAHASVKRGLGISTQTPVKQVCRQGKKLIVRTSRGDVASTFVIYACSGHIGDIVPELRAKIRLVPVQVQSTAPIAAKFRPGMAVDWGTTYWRQTSDGAIVIGGDGTTFLRGHGGALAWMPSSPALKEFLAVAFPSLPALQIRRQWTGVMDCLPDGRPIVGPISGRRNEWAVTGFNGHGIPLGLSIGRHVAESILTGSYSSVLEQFDPSRLGCLVRASQIRDQESLIAT